MVRARLHIICGNCGCNDMFKLNVDHDIMEDMIYVYLKCENCGTLHNLNHYKGKNS